MASKNNHLIMHAAFKGAISLWNLGLSLSDPYSVVEHQSINRNLGTLILIPSSF